MMQSRVVLANAALGLVAALLVACGAKAPVTDAPPVPPLHTLPVGSAGDAAGQGWEGVVEAVRQAVISSQTTGRVSRLEADVNDHVAAGAVLARLTAVEQQAGADAARAVEGGRGDARGSRGALPAHGRPCGATAGFTGGP